MVLVRVMIWDSLSCRSCIIWAFSMELVLMFAGSRSKFVAFLLESNMWSGLYKGLSSHSKDGD